MGKRTKKLMAFGLVLCMLTGLAGCGGNSGGKASESH